MFDDLLGPKKKKCKHSYEGKTCGPECKKEGVTGIVNDNSTDKDLVEADGGAFTDPWDLDDDDCDDCDDGGCGIMGCFTAGRQIGKINLTSKLVNVNIIQRLKEIKKELKELKG